MRISVSRWTKRADDFRNKKLFDFGFNDPDKIVLDGKTYVRAGTDWKLNGQTMDSGSVQSFIDQLRELSATKFVSSGFTSPVSRSPSSGTGTRIPIRSNSRRTRRGYIARRAGDSSLYQLDAKPVDDMLNAGKAIKPAAKK